MVQVLKYTLEAGLIFCIFQFFFNQVYCSLCYNKWNRIFLIFSCFASYLLPFIQIEYFENGVVNLPKFEIVNIVNNGGVDVITVNKEKTFRTMAENFFDSKFFDISVEILFAVYVAGVFIKLLAFFLSLKKTLKLKRNPLITTLDNNIKVFETKLNTVAFSFFKNIFLGVKAKQLSKEEISVVFEHEKQHISGKHTLDLICFSLFSALQWFNPAVKKAKENSKLVCENIADNTAGKDGGMTQYSMLILKLGISNNAKQTKKNKDFKQGFLVRRIAGLFNMDSDKVRKIRFISSLPVILTFFIAYVMIKGMFLKTNSGLEMPVQGKVKITSEFFEDKIYSASDGNIFKVRHLQTDFYTLKNQNVYSPFDAKVLKKEKNLISLKDSCGLTVVLGGFEVFDFQSDSIPKGVIIGKTTGELMFIKTYKNSLAVDPKKIFNFDK